MVKKEDTKATEIEGIDPLSTGKTMYDNEDIKGNSESETPEPTEDDVPAEETKPDETPEPETPATAKTA